MRDWTSSNELYDPQCREPEGIRCSQCGERYSEGELTYLDGRPFCPACLKEYIEEYGRAHTGEFADDYIEANLDERAADFWENDLDEQSKKKLLREIYQREKQRHRASHLHDIEQSDRDFCLESDNYFDFVRGQMLW